MVSASRHSVVSLRSSTPAPGPADAGAEEEQRSPQILAVVVTHNGGFWLEACLASLAEQIYPAMDVIVVDCFSEGDVAGEFGHLLPQAEFVRVERNVGFGAAANLALEVSSRAPDADYFLFLHDDVELEPEAVALMMATELETQAGIVGGKGLEWDHSERLVEVGMSADQFGYPYSGLEPGEIDQGQHDSQREALFVTNACMLVSRRLAECCGLWDGAYFAFGEDLDLCTRARLAGFNVVVQPGARYRHAEALSNKKRSVRRMPSVRFLTRRNRLRTIAKNFSPLRLLLAVPLYMAVSLAEMAVLAFFRKYDEIPEYPKAFGSFVASLPDVIRRRRAVQKRRTVSDRNLRRLMVRDADRARVFFEARLRAWERGTVELGARTLSHLAPSAIKASLVRWLRHPTTVASAAIVVLVALSMRSVLVGGPIAAGSLLPFPEETNRLLTEYFAGWRDVRLGTRSGAPAAFPILWLFGVLGLGKAVLAQKLMLVVLVAIGLFGMHLFVRRRTDLALARFLAVAVYALTPVLGAIVQTGDLQALALYAGMPYLLDIGLRILGAPGIARSQEPITDSVGKYVARLALATAGVVALAPSALVAVAAVWVILGLLWLGAGGGTEGAARRAGYVLASIPLAALVLIPWSLEALRPKGPALAPLFAGRNGTFSPLWSERTFQEMFFLNLRSAAAALVVVALTAGVLVLADRDRRSQARLLVSAWAGFSILGGLAAKGLIPAPAATPGIWLIFPLTAASTLAGDLVAGIRAELPRHAFGWRHKIAVPAIGLLLVAGLFLGWLPSLFSRSRPADTFAAGVGEQAASLASFLASTSDEVGDFRILWLGKRWVDPIRSGARPMDGPEYLVTGPGGIDMLDAQDPSPSPGERKLEQTVKAMAGGGVHLAGHLLAPASIRFIIVDPRDAQAVAAMRSQRDIGLEQQQTGIAVYRNLQWLPKAVLAPVSLVEAVTAPVSNDRSLMLVTWSGGRSIPQRSADEFVGELPRTRHSQILLGANFNRAWRASVGGEELQHGKAFGWANRFELPGDAEGQVRIHFAGQWSRIVWVLLQAGILVVAAGAAWAARAEIKGRLQ